MSAPRNSRRACGFTMPETVIVVAILGVAAVFAAAYLRSIVKRERLKSVVKEVCSIVLATRAEAMRRGQNCVMFVDPVTRVIRVWADTQPYDNLQDAGEGTLIEFAIPQNIYFRLAPAGALNGPNAVCFDGYLGNPALVDRIVFKPDGTLDPPQDPNCRAPLRPAAYTATVPPGSVNCNPEQQCRGIYISDGSESGDVANRNTFRISVDDFGPTGTVSLLKWVPTSMGGNGGENNYAPPPWRWVD